MTNFNRNTQTLERLPLTQNHLIGWWDEQSGLIYCKTRNVLLSIDLPTVLALLGNDNKNQTVQHNLALLLDTSKNLPELEVPVGFTANLELSNQPLFDNHNKDLTIINTEYLSIRILIKSKSNQLDELRELLSGLQAKTKKAVKYLNIEVAQTRQGWTIKGNDNFSFKNIKTEFLMPMILDMVMTSYYRASNFNYAFHGAAIQWQGYNLYFAAASGKGKSTLSSYFSSLDSTLLSDEVISLNKNFEPIQIKLPITLKPGSWNLANDLKEHPTEWQRPDGRKLKYYSPQWRLFQPGLKPVLILPNYDPNTEASILNIGPCNALKHLALSGYELLEEDKEEAIQNLLRWLNEIPKYQITYQDRSDVPEMISGVLNEAAY